jgi:hypothetical protein
VGSGRPSSPWSFPPTANFTSFSAPDCLVCAAAPAFSCLACLFTAHMGCGCSPLSCGVFLPQPLLQAFLLLAAGQLWPLLLSLAGLFIYSSMWDSPYPPLVLRAPHPLCCVSFSFWLLLIIQFLFFSLGGGWSVPWAMLIWSRVVYGSTAYRLAHVWSASSQAMWALPSGGGAGALLVSLFNGKWRCSVQAAGVCGEVKVFLFPVVFPVRCISSVSPRFYFRRHAFCFLPLATILESLLPHSLLAHYLR